MISSFVFSNNEVIACCNNHCQPNVEISADADSKEIAEEQGQMRKCCCNSGYQDSGDPLTPCENCECNCVQSVSYISSEFALEINLISITTYFTYGWHYNQPLPDKPLNSIWQPPQLS